MRIASCTLGISWLSAMALAVTGCDPREACELRKIGGAITVPPNEGENAWSLDRTAGRLSRYSVSSAPMSLCTQLVSSDAQIYPSHKSAWGVTKDSLWWLSPRCGRPHQVLPGNTDQYTQNTADVAVAIDDDRAGRLIISAAPRAEKQERLRSLFLISIDGTEQHETSDPLSFLDEAPGSILDRIKEEPSQVRVSRDDRWIWISYGERLCHLDVQALQQRSGIDWDVCKGRRFEGKRIGELSRSGSKEPLWIATDRGAFSWSPGSAPVPYDIGNVLSIDRSPEAPEVAWALTADGNLYRLDTSHTPNPPRRLPSGTAVRHVRSISGRLLLIGDESIAACRNCTAAHAPDVKIDTLTSGRFTGVDDGADGSLWLSGAAGGALCTLRPHYDLRWVGAPVGVAALLALILMIRRGLIARRLRPVPLQSPTTIVFFAANPTGTVPLDLDEEARAISVELERSDRLRLETKLAARPYDLLRALRKLQPAVVHFSGHGGSGPAPAPVAGAPPPGDPVSAAELAAQQSQGGLFFVGPDRRARLVTAKALARTFRAVERRVKLVVLSACYSEALAAVLREHVDCIVGMQGLIDDDAARNFAVGFYGGLADGASVEIAFRQGCAAISLEGLEGSDRPQLEVRPGVDPATVVLCPAGNHPRAAGGKPPSAGRGLQQAG